MKRRVMLALLGMAVLVVSASASTPRDMRVTNVSDNAFTVSWTTAAAETCSVVYGTAPGALSSTAYDVRGSGTSDDTHYVVVSGLGASTTYYFKPVSGGTTYDDGGNPYSAATGPVLGAPSPGQTVYGLVYKPDGSTYAEGAIVYFTLADNNGQGTAGSSQPLSCLVGADGYWNLNLGSFRTADCSGYFQYSASGDNLSVYADAAGDGTNAATYDTGAAAPAAPLTSEPDHVLTVSVEGSGSVTKDPDLAAYRHADNVTVTLTAVPDEHYHFVEWTGDATGTVSPTTVLMTADRSVTARFAIDTNPVTAFVSGGPGTVSPASQDVPWDGDATVTITPGTGYHIDMILDNGGPIPPPYGSSVTLSGVREAHAIEVVLAIDTFTVDASVSGGNGTVAPTTQTIDYGSLASVSITPDEGYYIASIKDNGVTKTIANPYVISSVTGNHTIVVTFSLQTFAVTASVSGGHGNVSPASQTVGFGGSTSVDITPDTGYHIASITDNGVTKAIANPYEIDDIQEAHEVVVTFAINTYAVTASVTGGHGSVDPASQTIDYGASASIAITPETGYHIASITDNGVTKTIANPYVISNVTAAHSVVVTFAIDTFAVTASVSGGHGSVDPASQTINYGAAASISITPETGYHIASITDNGVTKAIANPYVISNVTAAHAVVVTFVPDTFSVTASVSGGHGSVDPASQTINYGAAASISITPETGYHIASITDNGVTKAIANPYVISNVTAAHTVVVTFGIDYYTLTLTSSGPGTAAKSPDQAEYAYGTSVTLTATPDATYDFVGWSGDLSGRTTPVAVSMTGNKTVAAAFGVLRSVALQSGWNLISVPVVLSGVDDAAGLVGYVNANGGSSSQLVRWQNGAWDGYTAGVPVNSFDLETGKGYFNKGSAGGTLDFVGSYVSSVSIPLVAGWNLVGVPAGFMPAGTKAQDVIAEINGQGGSCTEVVRWVNGMWEGHVAGLPFNNFAIEDGWGYFAKCSGASTWRPNGNTPPDTLSVAVTNVTDTTFTVSWTTDAAETGRIVLGTAPGSLTTVVNDTRGSGTSSTTHYVEVTGLAPSTTYYFDVVSGGATYTNGGSHYTATTVATLSVPPSDQTYGQVFKHDGSTAAEGTIVYVTVRDKNAAGSAGDSRTLSCLTDANGFWYVNIGPVRTADGSAYFVYSASGDSVVIAAKGGADGDAAQTVDTSNVKPAPPMVLGGSVETIAVVVTNVTDTTFTVSWTTAEAKTGSIKVGTSPESVSTTVDDTRGAATSSRTHYVEVTGLSPATTYYFDAVSGAITYNNGGSHYSVTTGPMLESTPGPGVVYGQVFKSDGTTFAEGTIVYVKVRDNNGSGSSGDSQTFSRLISADGYWNMNPNSFRIPALSGYFSWTSGDQLVISAEGAGDGTASRTVDVAATPPFNMTLN